MKFHTCATCLVVLALASATSKVDSVSFATFRLLDEPHTPHFSAKGTHQCQSKTAIGHTCEVEGEFTDCDEAYQELKMEACCSTTKDEGTVAIVATKRVESAAPLTPKRMAAHITNGSTAKANTCSLTPSGLDTELGL